MQLNHHFIQSEYTPKEIERCPACGYQLEQGKEGTRAYCNNRFCHALVVVVPYELPDSTKWH